MYDAVVHEVIYEPGAFTRGRDHVPVPDHELYNALNHFRLSDIGDLTGHFENKQIVHLVSARVPHGSPEGVRIELSVIVPEPHAPDENLETSLARFEEFMEVRLGCSVDQSLRWLREDAEEE